MDRAKLRYFLGKQEYFLNFVKNFRFMDQKKRTEIASLGQFGLIDLLTSGFTPKPL